MSLGGKGSRIQETFHVDRELAKKSGHKKTEIHNISYVIKTVEQNPGENLETDYDGRYYGGRHNTNHHQESTYTQLLVDAREGKLKPSKAYSLIKHDQEIKKEKG